MATDGGRIAGQRRQDLDFVRGHLILPLILPGTLKHKPHLETRRRQKPCRIACRRQNTIQSNRVTSDHARREALGFLQWFNLSLLCVLAAVGVGVIKHPQDGVARPLMHECLLVPTTIVPNATAPRFYAVLIIQTFPIAQG